MAGDAGFELLAEIETPVTSRADWLARELDLERVRSEKLFDALREIHRMKVDGASDRAALALLEDEA